MRKNRTSSDQASSPKDESRKGWLDRFLDRREKANTDSRRSQEKSCERRNKFSSSRDEDRSRKQTTISSSQSQEILNRKATVSECNVRSTILYPDRGHRMEESKDPSFQKSLGTKRPFPYRGDSDTRDGDSLSDKRRKRMESQTQSRIPRISQSFIEPPRTSASKGSNCEREGVTSASNEKRNKRQIINYSGMDVAKLNSDAHYSSKEEPKQCFQYTKKTSLIQETQEYFIDTRRDFLRKSGSHVTHRERIGSNSDSDKSVGLLYTRAYDGHSHNRLNLCNSTTSFRRQIAESDEKSRDDARHYRGFEAFPARIGHRNEYEEDTVPYTNLVIPYSNRENTDSKRAISVLNEVILAVTEDEPNTVQERHYNWSNESDDCDEIDMMMAGRKNLNKNAISAFEEYGVQHRRSPKIEVVSISGPQHKPVFLAVARLGASEICRETGHSKHEARIKTAERALQMLSVKDAGQVSDSETSDGQPSDSCDEDVSNPVPYKDPVSALMEYAQFVKLEVKFVTISQEGPPHMPIFTMTVKLGSETCPSVKGSSAKETKKRAACMALNKLKQDGALHTLFPDTKTSTTSLGKVKTKSTLGVPGKNPVSVLNEYVQKSSTRLRYESSQTGPPHKPVFSVWAVLGEESFPAVKAASKKEGNVQAAESVLKILEGRGLYTTPRTVYGPSTSTNSVMPTTHTHHDRVASAAIRKVDELLLQTPESLVGRKVIAAIVMMDREQGVYRVVSVGSGNRCVKGSHITDDGTVIHDSHAEVLARRGFKRFLYWLLQTKDLPILVLSRQRKWRFKDGISFHLYISTAPCGDGALFTHSDRGVEGSSCRGADHSPVFSNTRTQGLLRAKQENGEGTIPTEPDFVGQTYDGIQQGGRLRVMSCSDKICQWNVLGLQGALLSTVYEPVYLQSITLGSLYNAGHLARAVCCRIDYNNMQLKPKLPNGYHVNHPDIGVTSCQDTARQVEKARPLSINWSFGDKEPETTDGTLGKTVKTVDRVEEPSRLCKKSLLSLYRKTIDNKTFKNSSYKQIKLDADDYNQAKMALHKRLEDQKFGMWVCMPREVDRFQ